MKNNQKTYISNIKRTWSYLVGSNYQDINDVIFNIYVLSGILIAFITIFANIFMQLGADLVYTSIGITTFYFVIYYLSRFTKLAYLAKIIAVGMLYPVFALLWFLNGGLVGSIPFMLMLVPIVGIAFVVKNRYVLAYLVFHIGFIVSLFLLEQKHPEWITPYETIDFRAVDMFVTLILVTLFSFIILASLRYAYESERKKAEKQAERLSQQTSIIQNKNTDLVELNSIKDRLLSIISHDLRTPISNLQATLEILNEGMISKEEFDSISAKLNENVKSTMMFMNNLLQWSKNQIQGIKPTIVEFNLNGPITDVAGVISEEATKKGINFTVQNDLSDTYVSADLEMTSIILKNLLANAIKFTPKGGEITVRTKGNLETVTIEVQDTGVGLSETQLKTLFEQQGITTPGTNNEVGFGLGLHVCKEFSEAQGGEIGVYSEPHQGATFWFTLQKTN